VSHSLALTYSILYRSALITFDFVGRKVQNPLPVSVWMPLLLFVISEAALWQIMQRRSLLKSFILKKKKTMCAFMKLFYFLTYSITKFNTDNKMVHAGNNTRK
jgi:hypothetical protein